MLAAAQGRASEPSNMARAIDRMVLPSGEAPNFNPMNQSYKPFLVWALPWPPVAPNAPLPHGNPASTSPRVERLGPYGFVNRPRNASPRVSASTCRARQSSDSLWELFVHADFDASARLFFVHVFAPRYCRGLILQACAAAHVIVPA